MAATVAEMEVMFQYPKALHYFVKTMHIITYSRSTNISNLHFAWVSPLQSHLQLSSVHHEGTGAGVGLGVGKADVQLRQHEMKRDHDCPGLRLTFVLLPITFPLASVMLTTVLVAEKAGVLVLKVWLP